MYSQRLQSTRLINLASSPFLTSFGVRYGATCSARRSFQIQLGLSKLPKSRFKPVVPHYMTYHSKSDGPSARWENTGLLYVCRQVYQESIAILYQENFFDFYQTRHQCSWGAFDMFTGLIPLARRKELRRVKIHIDSACSSDHHSKPLEHPASRNWQDLQDYVGIQHLVLITGSAYSLDRLFPEGRLSMFEYLNCKAHAFERLEIMVRGSLDSSIWTPHNLKKKIVSRDNQWSVQVWKISEYCWGLNILKKSKGPVAFGARRPKMLCQRKASLLSGLFFLQEEFGYCEIKENDIEWVDV